MDNDLPARPLQAASFALMVALTSCAAPQTSEPAITEATRARLAQALQASGDPVSAAALMQGEQPQKAPDFLLHVKALIAAGEVDEAMAAAKAAVAAHPDDPALALNVGRVAVVAGRLTEAGAFYLHALIKIPESVDAMNGQAIVMAQQGDLNAAAAVLRKALATHPKDITSSNNLALVMILRGEPDVAVSLLDDIDRSGGSPQIKATLAFARDRLGTKGDTHPAALAEPPLAVSIAPRSPVLMRETLPAASRPTVAVQPQPVAMVPPLANPDERRIVLRARAGSWMQVSDADGKVLVSREFKPGETWPVPARPGLVFATGNAGGTELVVDGVVAAPLGGQGMIRRDVRLDPDLIKDGKLPAQIRAARTVGAV